MPNINPYFAGLISGCLATVPMTVAMKLMHRRLPWHERYPLPPRQITMQAARGAGVKEKLDEPERKAATLLAHFGYGAAAGTVYAPLAHKLEAPPVVKGAGYGLAVWACSYLLGLPLLGFSASAYRQSSRRNTLMIVAHIIWGAALGLCAQALTDGDD